MLLLLARQHKDVGHSQLKRKGLKRSAMTVFVAILLFAVNAMPIRAVFADPLPQFSLATSSGRPGEMIRVTSADSCPPLPVDFEYQYVELTFTDADNIQTTMQSSVYVDQAGQWNTDGDITIPWRSYASSNTTDAAAPGPATIEAKCIVGKQVVDENGWQDPITQTSQTYAPKSFTVSGPSYEFSLSATTVRSGSNFFINSVDQCTGTEVYGSVQSNKGSVDFSTEPTASGSWSVNVQAYTHDEWSGTNTDLRAGQYKVRAYCNDMSGIGFVYYGEQHVNITGVNYVALGDSYSSGEGVEPFESGTAEPNVNECHRSIHAYARELPGFANLSALNLGSSGFAACSGATTEAITTPMQYNEPAQLERISEDTKLVTMTIGGNDMDFANFAYQCWITDCSGVAKTNAIAKIANTVIPNMRTMLDTVKSHLEYLENTDAEVLVVGYPHVLPAQIRSGQHLDCLWLNGQQEANAIRDVTSHLNTAIKNEVEATGSNFRFVSATDPGSPFAGHELCAPLTPEGVDTARFIYPIPFDAEKQRYSFHPNASGQWAYATLLEDYLYHHPVNLN